MTTKVLNLTATRKALTPSLLTASLLTASSLAQAHGSGSADSGWYHYFSSPDHVVGFLMLGLGVVALVGQLMRRVKVTAQRHKR